MFCVLLLSTVPSPPTSACNPEDFSENKPVTLSPVSSVAPSPAYARDHRAEAADRWMDRWAVRPAGRRVMDKVRRCEE